MIATTVGLFIALLSDHAYGDFGAFECPCLATSSAVNVSQNFRADYGMRGCRAYDLQPEYQFGKLFPQCNISNGRVSRFCSASWCYVNETECAQSKVKCSAAGGIWGMAAVSPFCRSRPYVNGVA